MTKVERAEAQEVIAHLSKEHIKSLFYLFSGKPDSRIKVFETPVYLEPGDLVELNECVTRKLVTHSIYAQVVSVRIGYIGSDYAEFGAWEEFRQHHWQEPERVEEVIIKWDFMVNIDQYELPQRHTLLVRISRDTKAGKVIQLLTSGNHDEFDSVDMYSAPAFCRVDFINAQLSRELVSVVDDWYKGRKEPALIPGIYYSLKKKREIIAVVTHHSIPFMIALAWLAYFSWSATNTYGGNPNLRFVAIWLFFGLIAYPLIMKFGHIVASGIFNALKKIAGSKVVFEFTSGDKKKNAELINENKKVGRNFIKRTAWALFLNVIAGIIATYLYTNS